MKRHILTTTLILAGAITASAITYQEWKALKFTAAEQYDLSISGQAADPDKDGQSNMLEFAFDTDPKFPDESQHFVYQIDSNSHLTLQYLHWKNHAGILYVPQITSTLLGGWQSGTGYIETIGQSDLDTEREIISLRDPLVVGQASKRFFRVLVDNDQDGDGLPDAWELLNGLSPLYAGDLYGDIDGDGRSNYQEFLDGTDPLTSDNPPAVNAPPGPPTNVRMVENSDGSIDVWWEDTSDNETYFVIRRQRPDATWEEVGRVGPGQTYFHLPAQQ